MKRSLLLFLLGVVCVAKGQIVIKPGDKIIRYDWVQPGHDFYRCQVKDTTGKLLYDFMMENFTSIDQAKNQITFARYRQVPKGNFSTDTSVTDLQFKPIRMHEIHYQRGVDYDMQFGNDKAIVKTNRKGTLSQRSYPMQPGFFEDNMIEYILGCLDLKKDVTYKLDNFNKDTPTPSDPYIINLAFEDTQEIVPDHGINYAVCRFIHGSTSGYVWIDKGTHLVTKIAGYSKNSSYIVTKI